MEDTYQWVSPPTATERDSRRQPSRDGGWGLLKPALPDHDGPKKVAMIFGSTELPKGG